MKNLEAFLLNQSNFLINICFNMYDVMMQFLCLLNLLIPWETQSHFAQKKLSPVVS